MAQPQEGAAAAEQSARGVWLVLLAALLWSFSGVLIRMLHMDIWSIQLWRSITTFVVFVPILYFVHGPNPWKAIKAVGWIDLLCAALGSVAMFSFVSAVALTTVADVLVVYATLPFLAALFGWLISREKVSGRTLTASLFALTGVLIMVSGAAGKGRLLGDLLSLSMTITFGLQLVILRKYQGRSIVIINMMSIVANVVVCLCFAPLSVPGATDLVVVTAVGALTIGLGMMLFNLGARLIPSAKASLIGLIEVVLGPLWVWLLFAENPGSYAMVGGVLVLAAVVWQIVGEISHKKGMA